KPATKNTGPSVAARDRNIAVKVITAALRRTRFSTAIRAALTIADRKIVSGMPPESVGTLSLPVGTQVGPLPVGTQVGRRLSLARRTARAARPRNHRRIRPAAR